MMLSLVLPKINESPTVLSNDQENVDKQNIGQANSLNVGKQEKCSKICQI